MEQIVAVCHRSWGNREGDTAFAMWSRSWHHSTDHGNDTACTMWSRSWQCAADHGEIVKVIQFLRWRADRGTVPQIMEEIVKVMQLARWGCRRCSSALLWTSLLPCTAYGSVYGDGAVDGGLLRFCCGFRASPGCLELGAIFGALDDEEFFVIEGSHAQLMPRICRHRPA